MAQQREWDRVHGDGAWAIGYLIAGEFVLQDDALKSVYQASYEAHFEAHPGDLEELVTLAKGLRNPHAQGTTGVDLQVPAIMACLAARGLELAGDQLVDIGTWRGERSHAISERLSPLQIKCCLDPRRTLEGFWQQKKCLAIWS
tara:strand:+ start:464 stop:895 length:432 start_codon:yes stop_codon:yes gene_type:complete